MLSGGVSAQLGVDERETTELVLSLVQVADRNGLRLPREFGLLLKQVRVSVYLTAVVCVST